jgi:hypothetical protein
MPVSRPSRDARYWKAEAGFQLASASYQLVFSWDLRSIRHRSMRRAAWDAHAR